MEKKSVKYRRLWRNAKRCKPPVIMQGEEYVRIACLVDDKGILNIEPFRYYKPDFLHVPWKDVVEENRIVSWCYFAELLKAEVAGK